MIGDNKMRPAIGYYKLTHRAPKKPVQWFFYRDDNDRALALAAAMAIAVTDRLEYRVSNYDSSNDQHPHVVTICLG